MADITNAGHPREVITKHQEESSDSSRGPGGDSSEPGGDTQGDTQGDMTSHRNKRDRLRQLEKLQYELTRQVHSTFYIDSFDFCEIEYMFLFII